MSDLPIGNASVHVESGTAYAAVRDLTPEEWLEVARARRDQLLSDLGQLTRDAEGLRHFASLRMATLRLAERLHSAAAGDLERLEERIEEFDRESERLLAETGGEVKKLRAWRANGCTHPQEMVRAAMESGTVHNVTARVVTCVFCGHEYPDGTPTSQNDKLTEHIRACEKHPMREVERQFRLATDALVRLSTLGGGNSEGNNIAKDALSNLSRNAINSNTHLNDLGMNQIREVFGMRAESHGLDVATVVSARVCKLERLLSEAIQCLTADDHGGTHAAGRMCPRCELVRNAKALLTLSGRPDVRPNSDWEEIGGESAPEGRAS